MERFIQLVIETLELRLSPPDNNLPGRLWGPALTVFGLLLLFYRES